VVERAEQKLQMDAAVIQSGRLAEKQKARPEEDGTPALSGPSPSPSPSP